MQKQESLPDAAEVVIIGGGVIGCSTAYHLAKFGKNDVVLLEQGQLSCGTTWHAAGLVGQLRSTPAMTDLIRCSTERYAPLEEETGLATGWMRTGSVSAARSDGFIYFKSEIGEVRSAAYGHTLGASVALADMHDNGTPNDAFMENGEWSIDQAGQNLTAKAYLRTPYDPKSLRPRVGVATTAAQAAA